MQKIWRQESSAAMTDDDPITLKEGSELSVSAKRYRKNPQYFNARGVKQYQENPEYFKAKASEWNKNHPEARSKIKKQYWKGDPARNRSRRLKREYGIDGKQWQEMFAEQDSQCAICKSSEPGSTHGWHTDHIHGTKIVRGILCHQCNTMLGRAKDNPATLAKAIIYLNRHDPSMRDEK